MFLDALVLGATVVLQGKAVAARASTPCQSVSSMSVDYTAMFPQATEVLVPAQAAEDCLRSVPIDKEEDLALIEEMQSYINWQSNLAYLVDPPEGYTSERIDVLEEIARISKDLQDDKYTDEFTLMTDLQSIIVRAYDFHFVWSPDIAGIFQFQRGNIGHGLADDFALASVSSDGKEPPKLYNYYDIMVAEEEGWTASPVTRINNQSAEDYVQKWSDEFPYLEDHARYNILFPNQASQSTGLRTNRFGSSLRPDGDFTFVEHENGTVIKLVNSVQLGFDVFDGIEDGNALFAKFCNQGPNLGQNSRKRSAKSDLVQEMEEAKKRATRVMKRQEEVVPTPTGLNVTEPQETQAYPTGYPAPAVYHSEGIMGGYYLEGQDYDDIAVLSVPSFQPATTDGFFEFQDTVGAFLKEATAAGKKKLIIDLRGNGGGRVFLGYDLFKQLFPSEDPYGASEFRANEAFREIGQAVDDIYTVNNITLEAVAADYEVYGANSTLFGYWVNIFNWRLPYTIDGQNFTSWDEYFGPETRQGDNFTTLSRRALGKYLSDDTTTPVTGYGALASALNTTQPFTSDNIVLLQDGGCGSTCAIFSEFMKSQGRVQQIVVGGKPVTGPMQGVAGSKGSQVYAWSEINVQASTVYGLLPPEQQEIANETAFGTLISAQRPLLRSGWNAETGSSSSVINLRDNIRENDTSVTPLEFVYEAADCRLFYTGDMVRNVTNVWKKTVDAMWGGGDVCVEGSTGHPSSLTGAANGNGTQGNSSTGNSTTPGENYQGGAGKMGGRGALVVGIVAVVAACLL